MARILRLYVIREVAVPTFITLITMTFILLIAKIFDFVNLMLQPGVSAWEVLRVLALLIPPLLVFATPMAMLMGALIGVGRLTLDREILAARASGINLFSIFFPGLILALGLSAGIMWLEANIIPRSLLAGLSGFAELEFKIVNSLEPGRFYKKLGGDNSDFILYFSGRDPKTNNMTGVVVRLENDFKLGSGDKVTKQASTKAKLPSPLAATATSAASETQALMHAIPLDEKGKPIAHDDSSTLFFAESGAIRAELNDTENGSNRVQMVVELFNGTSHHLAEEKDGDYTISSFSRMQKTFVFSDFLKSLNDERKTRTNAELRKTVKNNASNPKSTSAGPARAELIRRFSISLASFVFAFMGIPLAIWVRPSGKSWGILIAVGLMFAYYALMQWGLTLVQGNKPLGLGVAFAPDFLFLLLGVVLWWRTLRS